MRYTIHDIARELGISARTVSRVINQQNGVRRDLRERVEQFVKEVGYEPHAGARSLRKTPQTCIGIVSASPLRALPLSEPLLAWLFGQMYRLFGQRGAFVEFDLNPPSNNGVRDYGRGLWQRRYTALAVVGAFPVTDTLLPRIHDTGLPYVALARLRGAEYCNTATVDYEEATYLSTRHLLARGHKRIGLLMSLDGFQPGAERRAGYWRALEEASVCFEASLVRAIPLAANGVRDGLAALLSEEGVTAVVDCSGAEDAEGLRAGARLANRAIGPDLEMVVWTYTSGACILREAVAHVFLPVRESVTEGLERLSGIIYENKGQGFQILYKPVLFTPEDGPEMKRPRSVFDVSLLLEGPPTE